MLSRLAAIALVLLAPLATGAELERVWTSYRTAQSFQRISEFFSGREDTGADNVLRSHPEVRDGFYFLARARSGTAIPDAIFVIEIVRAGSPEVQIFRFPAHLPAGRRVFQLGLTGADWPTAKAHPSAWRVTLRGADGTVLASQQSFLWSQDAKR